MPRSGPRAAPFTSIERALIERLIRLVLADMAIAFAPLSAIEFRYERLETNPRFAAIARPTNGAVLFKLRIEMDDRGGPLEILIPYATLEPVRDLLLQMFMGEKFGRDSIWETHLARQMLVTTVELEALLEEQTIPLGEVMALQVGTTLPLTAEPDTPVILRCGTRPAAARPGRPDRRPRRDPDRGADRPRAGARLMLPLLVDGLIVVLLLVVLGRGVRLQRNLRDLRSGDGEIERLIAALDRASARAQAALDGLRQTTEATSERLAGQLASAQRLLDDLQFLTGRGEQAADRLDGADPQGAAGRRALSDRAARPEPAAAADAANAGRAGDRPRAHAQDAAMSAGAGAAAASRAPAAARGRAGGRSLPMLLMAALGALALAKLGLLAERAARPVPDRARAGRRSQPGRARSAPAPRSAPEPAAGADAGGWSRDAGAHRPRSPAPEFRSEAAPAPPERRAEARRGARRGSARRSRPPILRRRRIRASTRAG